MDSVALKLLPATWTPHLQSTADRPNRPGDLQTELLFLLVHRDELVSAAKIFVEFLAGRKGQQATGQQDSLNQISKEVQVKTCHSLVSIRLAANQPSNSFM